MDDGSIGLNEVCSRQTADPTFAGAMNSVAAAQSVRHVAWHPLAQRERRVAAPGNDLSAANAARDTHDCNRVRSNVIEPVVHCAMHAAGYRYASVVAIGRHS